MAPPTRRNDARGRPASGRNSSKNKIPVSPSPTSANRTNRADQTSASLSASPAGSTVTNITQPPSVVGGLRVIPESAMYSSRTGRRVTGATGGILNTARAPEDVSEVSMRGADDSWFVSVKKGQAEDGKNFALNKYVRQTLFPRWKFFTSSLQLVWSNNTTSIPQFSCEKMNVKPEFGEWWWCLNQSEIMKQLNQKRSDVGGAMKKVFMGKFLCLFVSCFCILHVTHTSCVSTTLCGNPRAYPGLRR